VILIKIWIHNAKRQSSAERLLLRLQKFYCQETPERYAKKGEQWGAGQLEIELEESKPWRGEIESATTHITDEGVHLIVLLRWFAEKRNIEKEGKWWGIREKTWEWVSFIDSFQVEFTIVKFYQDKGKPKRLYFTTSEGRNGFFTQRHDHGNIILENESIVDPLLAGKRFSVRKSV